MKRTSVWAAALCVLAMIFTINLGGEETASTDGPQFNEKGELMRPTNYQEWVFIGSGLGMNYNEAPSANSPSFTNVYANPSAYRSFMKTGTWPDKTALVLEIRGSVNHASIDRQGRTQGEVRAIEMNVKDEKRFPNKWALYNFPRNAASVAALPQTASCYTCHAEHGAVEMTFVQFYPSLYTHAQAKGTLKHTSQAAPGSQADNKLVLDPVCQMDVTPQSAAAKVVYKEKTYYFCNEDCKQNFEKAPDEYAKLVK